MEFGRKWNLMIWRGYFIFWNKETIGNLTVPGNGCIFSGGYIELNLLGIIVMIRDRNLNQYLHGAKHLPVDFPADLNLKKLGSNYPKSMGYLRYILCYPVN